jgi:hypothetical protein
MSVKSALKDPVVRVVLALGLIPAAGIALYWLAMIPINHRYELLSRITETWKAAQDCQHAVEEYYGRVGHMPASEKDVACHRGSGSVAPARVASGVIFSRSMPDSLAMMS